MPNNNIIISRSKNGMVIWSNERKMYIVRFKLMALYLPSHGFQNFKDSLTLCYETTINSEKRKENEFLQFKTSGGTDDFKLSIEEVGDLLNLLQMSSLQEFALQQLPSYPKR